MHIAIIHESVIPVKKYGGTQRDIWYLGYELTKMGHKVTYIVNPGSECPFADVIEIDKEKNINELIPDSVDIVNIHHPPKEEIEKPFLHTMHGNTFDISKKFPENTVFVSPDHAKRYGSDAYIYNGMKWDEYPAPDLKKERKGYHFLGNAAWKVKNLKAAIKISRANKKTLEVMGGYRFNFKMGMRFTLNPKVHFHGMVGDDIKGKIMNRSEALLFPVLWHEPMGLAVIESLYFGCPVFATSYGSLPYIVNDNCGFLSDSLDDLIEAAKNSDEYNRKYCHEYARDNFNSKKMAENYLKYFDKVIKGEKINRQLPQLLDAYNEKYLPFKW